MTRKIARFIINTILVLAPTFPILASFFPIVDTQNFSSYLLGCGIIAIILFILAYTISEKSLPSLTSAAWLLFLLGLLIIAPLHMGPPKQDENLLQFASLEKFRYAMLLFAMVVFCMAIVAVVRPIWDKLKMFERSIVGLLVIAIPILIWDNYDSFMLSEKLLDWKNLGKNPADFFPNYDFHESWRAFGRILLYVITIALCAILYRRYAIKKAAAFAIMIFSLIGIGFCLAFVNLGFQYYFPFMVPAIALSPAYWTGIALLNKGLS